MANKRGAGSATRAPKAARPTGRAVKKSTGGGGRYTPPIPREKKVSPKWMLPAILGLAIIGLLVIILNYFDGLPFSPTNWYLLVGLVFLAGSLGLGTRYH